MNKVDFETVTFINLFKISIAPYLSNTMFISCLRIVVLIRERLLTIGNMFFVKQKTGRLISELQIWQDLWPMVDVSLYARFRSYLRNIV